MANSGEYEPDMRVIFDVLSKTVVVTFRGSIHMLGPFATQAEGIEAGKKLCRAKGWTG